MDALNKKLISVLQLIDDESGEMQKIIRSQILENALELIINRSRYQAALATKFHPAFSAGLEQLHEALVFEGFRTLLNNSLEDINLEKGMFLISYWSDSSVDCYAMKRTMDEISQSVSAGIPESGHPLAFLDHVSHYLFREFNISGNNEDYYNPHNSYLHKLFETRKGIPITIGILYMLICNRLQLPVYGVPLPGHFILKYYNGEDEIFFDPFYEGKIYSRQMCLNYLKNVKLKNAEQVLNGCSNYDIVIRILKNLRLVYSSYQNNPEMLSQIESFMDMFENRPISQY